MKKHEKEILSAILSLTADTFCNHGCNDYRVLDTSENRNLYIAVAKYTGDFEAQGEDFSINFSKYELSGPEGKRRYIYFLDYELMRYFAAKLQKG